MIPDALSRALNGIRVLSLEQAVALPFATRHLAELGADVVRVQSFERARPGGLSALDLTRPKRQLGLNLAAEGGPEVFRRLAAASDVVAHNFTPRVLTKFGIDYEAIRSINEQTIYVSLTGFGTTGPWGGRPLFGPGAEAVSGHNLLIGDPEGWPGRPGTGVYADDVCGLYTVHAVLAALDERDRSGRGQHIDISLYETMVAHLAPVIAERSRGAVPQRASNGDRRWAIHNVFAARGIDRHVAVAAAEEQLPALAAALAINEATPDSVASAIGERDASETTLALQAAGIAASVVADAADTLTDDQLWSRGFFEMRHAENGGTEADFPHCGTAWGGNTRGEVAEPHQVGADNAEILREIGGFDDDEIARLSAAGAIGTASTGHARRSGQDAAIRIKRGEISRVDEGAERPDWTELLALARAAGLPRAGR